MPDQTESPPTHRKSVGVPRPLLEAYSRGELTRREIEDRTGEAISFGRLLGFLHEQHLPLPRIPSDRQSPGVQLIKRLAELAPRA
jgi:hypothetical protein